MRIDEMFSGDTVVTARDMRTDFLPFLYIFTSLGGSRSYLITRETFRYPDQCADLDVRHITTALDAGFNSFSLYTSL
jgi:hypothetical protein